MASNTSNVKLGVCQAIFDGVDLGFTQGGVEVEVATTTHEVKVDQTGETPINELITGRTVSAKIPLAETTLENLVRIMPGAVLISNGVKAVGTITLSVAPPANGDLITLAGVAFTWKTVPVGVNDMPIAATFGAAASALASKINASATGFQAVAVAGVVTITASDNGVAGNTTLTKTATNVVVVAPTGGLDATIQKVAVSTGVNVSLLSVAKTLILRPIGTSGEDDFTILKAASPGAMSFAYKLDKERVYMANFKGYAGAQGQLFEMGNSAAA